LKVGRVMDFDESMIYLPSTTELLEAGVRFKVNTKTKCLLDLRFSGRVLEIPQLRVEDRTVTLFGIWLLWSNVITLMIPIFVIMFLFCITL